LRLANAAGRRGILVEQDEARSGEAPVAASHATAPPHVAFVTVEGRRQARRQFRIVGPERPAGYLARPAT
jgi:hypothetical protein